MAPRNLFSIILKVIGIFFIKNILIEVGMLLPTIGLISKEEYSIINFLIPLFALLIYFLITYLLLFKTNWVIAVLQLDKGFQQDNFNLNIHRSTILRIAIIVVSGLIIIDALPMFFQQLLYFIQMKKERMPGTKIDYVILQSAKLLVGILLISYQKVLVNFIEYKSRY